MTKLSHSTFSDLVNDPETDKLIMFYVPWMERTAKLTPILEELANSIKESDIEEVKSIVIGKLDATVNDVGELFITDYPALIWYRADGGVPETCGAPRDIASL